MATSTRRTRRAIGIALATSILLASVGVGLMVASGGASADVSMDGLTVDDHEATVGGDVSDVLLATTIGFSHDVPDASRRIVRVEVGPSEDSLETLAFKQERDPSGTASGEVDLTGSLVSDGPFTADTFNPALAGNETTQVVVQATIEVHRENGDPVRHTVTDTATVRLSDDAELTVDLGGSGSFEVET